MERISVTVSRQQKNALKRQVRAGKSLSSLVREALDNFLWPQQKKKAAK